MSMASFSACPPGGLVATSLYPGSRFDHQRACFERWRALGLRVLSFNARIEHEQLCAAGLPADALVEIGDEETLLADGRGAKPRILSVLRRVLADGAERAMLVNSDIYPAISRDPLALMTSPAAATAWVRSDVATVDQPADAPVQPYHGGLDIFCFRRGALDELVEILNGQASAPGMAFGVPGWDLRVGHEVLRAGGQILEARFLLHPRHAPGYSSIDSFAPMAAEMWATGRYRAADHVAIAAEFVDRIYSQCQRHAADARVLQLALAAPAAASSSAPAAAGAAGTALDRLDPMTLQLQRQRPDWPSLHLAFGDLTGRTTPLAVFLEALRAGLALRAAEQRLPWVTDYPDRTAHAEQLASCMAEQVVDTRRWKLLNLLAADLYEHGTLNLNLLKYLAAHCAHAEEERLFAALVADLRSTPHEAPATAA